jgi:hypothetical protein
MARNEFNELRTVQFQRQMRVSAIRIYKAIFPNCEIEDLRTKGKGVHILDKEFAIDSLIQFPSGNFITLQEKYRENKYIQYSDFTQEYNNAVGTEYESVGEWFKLAAQLYFYGWANKDNTDFEKWIMLDILRYKLLVEKAGGLGKIGILKINETHGRASFYAIPVIKLKDAIIYSSQGLENP